MVQLPQGPRPGDESFEGHRRLGQKMMMEGPDHMAKENGGRKSKTSWKKKLGYDHKNVENHGATSLPSHSLNAISFKCI